MLSSTSRVNNLAAMARESVDVLVIGGGITGAGVALDAVTRGYRVALVEKNDFASGTSSKSTKLAHGGIRYLPNFDFPLVYEALHERDVLFQIAPHLVQPLPFILPIYAGDRHPIGIPFTTPGGVGLRSLIDLGLWMYDLMAGRRTVPFHQRLSPAQVMALAPTLVHEGLEPSFAYYDGQTDDARLTLTVLATAAAAGALIANHAEVTSLLSEGGVVSGARLRDHLTGAESAVRARYTVNAGGIFSESIAALGEDPLPVRVMPSKGVHLVFARELFQISDHAIVLPQTSDGRILFIVPWKSRVIFGTTDMGDGDLDHPRATEEDIDYLLEHLNRYNAVMVTRADIIGVYAGYRPLILPRGSHATSKKLSRTHMVIESQPHFISIFGGKLTTYRRMAQDAVDAISRHDGHPVSQATKRVTLAGGEGWTTYQATLTSTAAQLGLPPDIASHLGASYGTHARDVLALVEGDPALGERLIADLPYLRAEVIYAVRAEMALTIADVLARRTSIILEDRHQGGQIIEQVADLMGRELDWSPTTRRAQIAEYRQLISEYAPQMSVAAP